METVFLGRDEEIVHDAGNPLEHLKIPSHLISLSERPDQGSIC